MAIGETREVSLLSIYQMFRKHRASLIWSTLFVTALFVAYAAMQPTRYRAEALLGADDDAVKEYLKANAPAGGFNIQEKLWLVREHLFSPTVLEPLIEEFHLDQEHDGMEYRLRSWMAQLPRWFHSQKVEEPNPENHEEETLDAVKKRITIRVEAVDAFSIGFEGKDRRQATDVANRLAQSLVQRTSAASEQNASSAAGFLKGEAERVRQKLDQQNATIQQYRERTADDLPTRMAGDLKIFQTLQEQIHAKTEQITNDQARRVAVVQEMQDFETRGALESPAKPEADSKLQQLRARLKELRAIYTEQYPEIKSVEKQIQDLEKEPAGNNPANAKQRGEPSPAQMRYVELKAELGSIDQRLNSYRSQQKDLAAELGGYEKKAASAPAFERTIAELTRDYELTRTQYQSLLDKENQAQIDERLNKVTQASVFKIVRMARPPLMPSGPHRARIVLAGLVGGLAFGIGLAFLGELRDTSYGSADEFQDATNLPVLAIIPSVAANGHTRSSGHKPVGLSLVSMNTQHREVNAAPISTVVTLNDPKSIAAEQYGILAMEVRQRLGRDASRVLAITSAAGGEGKTITSLNLSIALSRTMEGQVLLLESDLRKPRLHEYLGFQPGKGFSDLLQRPDDPIEPYLWKLNGLSVMPGGPILDDPLKFLASSKTQDVFARLRQAFRFIVVDTPPIVPVADSHLLGEMADGVVLVVRAGHTRRELFKHALQNYRVPHILGVVLNGVNLQQSRYSYAYDYYSKHYLGGEKGKGAYAS